MPAAFGGEADQVIAQPALAECQEICWCRERVVVGRLDRSQETIGSRLEEPARVGANDELELSHSHPHRPLHRLPVRHGLDHLGLVAVLQHRPHQPIDARRTERHYRAPVVFSFGIGVSLADPTGDPW